MGKKFSKMCTNEHKCQKMHKERQNLVEKPHVISRAVKNKHTQRVRFVHIFPSLVNIIPYISEIQKKYMALFLLPKQSHGWQLWICLLL